MSERMVRHSACALCRNSLGRPSVSEGGPRSERSEQTMGTALRAESDFPGPTERSEGVR